MKFRRGGIGIDRIKIGLYNYKFFLSNLCAVVGKDRFIV